MLIRETSCDKPSELGYAVATLPVSTEWREACRKTASENKTQENVRLCKIVHTEQIMYGTSPPSLQTPHPKQLIYKHSTYKQIFNSTKSIVMFHMSCKAWNYKELFLILHQGNKVYFTMSSFAKCLAGLMVNLWLDQVYKPKKPARMQGTGQRQGRHWGRSRVLATQTTDIVHMTKISSKRGWNSSLPVVERDNTYWQGICMPLMTFKGAKNHIFITDSSLPEKPQVRNMSIQLADSFSTSLLQFKHNV